MPYSTAVAALALAATPALATIRYVDRTAPAGGDGLSWATSHNDLQAALAAATLGDEIRIAQGVYRPGPVGSPRTITFAIPSGVALRGGYAGRGAPDPDARNITAFITTLSADLAGNDGPNFTNRSENAFHVATITSGGEMVLDGLVLAGGNSVWTLPDDRGGGLRINGASPIVVDCTFQSNYASSGGGVHMTGGSPQFIRCTFAGNEGQSNGAGASVNAQSAARFTDCTFRANIGGVGGGAFSSASIPTFERCLFTLNTGDIGIGSGAGFYDSGGASTLRNCSFVRNTNGSGGGGVYSEGSATAILNCSFLGNRADFDGGGALYLINAGQRTVAGCLFDGNITQAGGNIAFVGSGSTAAFISCTMVNNGAGQGSFAIYGNVGNCTLRNSILWNNRDHTGLGQSSAFGGNIPQISYSTIQGWTGSLGGPGNSGADPLFADLDGPDNTPGNDDDNPRLSPGSPAIDSADNTALPAAITTDLDGLPRFADDPATPDTGIPGGAGGPLIADRGAYEFHPPVPPCYPNCDGSTVAPILNVNDFTCFLNRYAQGDPYANCDGSTQPPVLNINDFQCFLNRYAQGCP